MTSLTLICLPITIFLVFIIVRRLEKHLIESQEILDRTVWLFIERGKELRQREEEVKHWKANHDEMVARNAILRDRPDLPVDRLPALKRLDDQILRMKLQNSILKNEISKLRGGKAGK